MGPPQGSQDGLVDPVLLTPGLEFRPALRSGILPVFVGAGARWLAARRTDRGDALLPVGSFFSGVLGTPGGLRSHTRSMYAEVFAAIWSR